MLLLEFVGILIYGVYLLLVGVLHHMYYKLLF